MNAPRASLAALAVLLSLTACSQTLVEFVHNGVPHVGVPVETWEAIVAKRISANDLSRARARSIVLLSSTVDDERAKAESYRRDAEDARTGEREALRKLNEAIEINGKLSRKLKRRTPWATAMKLQVGLILAGGILYGYQTLSP